MKLKWICAVWLALILSPPVRAQSQTTTTTIQQTDQRTVVATQSGNATIIFSVLPGITNHQFTYTAQAAVTALTVTVSGSKTGPNGTFSTIGTSSTVGDTITGTGTYDTIRVVYTGYTGSGNVEGTYFGNSSISQNVNPPSGGATANQVAYWTGAFTIGGDSGLTYTPATDILGTVGGVLIGSATTLDPVGDATLLMIRGPAATAASMTIMGNVADGANTRQGDFAWSAASNLAAADLRIVMQRVSTQGATATARGGMWDLYTKGDALGLVQAIRVNNLQQTLLATSTAAAPSLGGLSFTTSGMFLAAGPTVGMAVSGARAGAFTSAGFELGADSTLVIARDGNTNFRYTGGSMVPAADNNKDLGENDGGGTLRWRTLYGATSVLTPLVASESGGLTLTGFTTMTLKLSTSNAIVLNVGRTVTMPAYTAGAATFDSSGNITSVSDGRLKDIQRAYSVGLEALRHLTPQVYKWKPESGFDTTNEYAGFIAQDVLATIGPLGVGGPNQDGYYSLQERAITAALVNTVKELDERLLKLEQAPR